ncbi:hypothetical protein G7076_05315 [Sphingomonas sp. HDW15A]|uniref:hypothetical protein n=1 Tax=Sphingomonas sp. HDW15A TaxID=2714942 RepID=UPI0014079F77|nr:hypothetical protein [Sphingomonas sp. HDW15A]QIK95961.1 hypothetical protein G7076_05315 [Sphingomonas sp. HDW15A]
MATTKKRSTSSRSRSSGSSSSSARNDGLAARTGRTIRNRPYASTAIAAGAASLVAGIAGLVMAKRNSGKNWGEFGDDLSTRASNRLSEAKTMVTDAADRLRHRDGIDPDRSQSEIMEEALTLKETGKKTKGSRGPTAQQDIKAGIATSNQEAKAGAKAYS